MPDDPMADAQPGRSHGHRQCGAKTRAGTPCQLYPPPGATRCFMHGGKTPQAKRAAKRRLAQAAAAKAVARLGARRDITPAEALLELVQAKAAEVAYWESKVAELPDEQVAGVLLAKTEKGIGPQGPVDTKTRQAGPHVFLTLLHEAQDQLASYSAAALKAGVDEAMVRIATLQGHTAIELARQVAARLGASADRADEVLLQVIDEQRKVLSR